MSNIFTNLKDLDIQKATRSEMGDLSFQEREKELQFIKKFFTSLEGLNADKFLPNETLERIKQQYGQFLDLVNALINFDYKRTDVNINQERQNLFNRIVSIRNHLFDAYHSVIPYLFLENKKYDEIFQEINERYQAVRKLEENISNVARESQEALNSIKTATGEAVSLYYSDVFAKQAEEHKKGAKDWLIATGTMGSILLIFLIFFLFKYLKFGPELNTYQTLHILLYKALALSVLYLGLHQCIKNYRAHRHLYILNKHRDSALKTFEAFVNASSKDKDIKDTLLTIAAKSIYNINKTGYLAKDEQNSYNFSLNDIIRQVTTDK